MDVRSLEAVFRQEHSRLWRSLFAYTGDRDLASDAVAETFAQALGRGDLLVDPAAWVWRSAFGVAGGLMQKRERIVLVAELPDIEFHEGPVVEILSILDTLSPQQRAVIALRYVGELDIGQISETLGTTAGTVRVQLHRAHASLRISLEDET